MIMISYYRGKKKKPGKEDPKRERETKAHGAMRKGLRFVTFLLISMLHQDKGAPVIRINAGMLSEVDGSK